MYIQFTVRKSTYILRHPRSVFTAPPLETTELNDLLFQGQPESCRLHFRDISCKHIKHIMKCGKKKSLNRTWEHQPGKLSSCGSTNPSVEKCDMLLNQQAIWKVLHVVRNFCFEFEDCLNAQRLITYGSFPGKNILKEPQGVSLPGLNTAYNKKILQKSLEVDCLCFPTTVCLPSTNLMLQSLRSVSSSIVLHAGCSCRQKLKIQTHWCCFQIQRTKYIS